MSFMATSASLSLRALGWEYDGLNELPNKFVGIAWPHSANMDGVLMVLLAEHIHLTMSWMVKDAVNKPVLGSIVRGVGGVFIDRSKANGVVEQMVEKFNERERLALMVPPEGTRSYRDRWKSGFYHIAVGAGVPIVPSYLDYSRKRGGFLDPIDVTGDVKKDMDAIRAAYATVDAKGKFHKDVGPIILREEEEDEDV